MTDTRIVTAPRVRPLFQVAAGDADVVVGQARYDVARYDETGDTLTTEAGDVLTTGTGDILVTGFEASYAGLDAEWTDDVGCDVIDAVVWLGRQRSADVFDVGTATVTLRNVEGFWDYPPVAPVTPLTVRPGRMARVGVEIDGSAPVWLFTGWIDATRPEYNPVAELDAVTVDVVCAKGEFGRVDLPAVTTPVGAGETVGDRMTRYADAARFPDHRRLFDPSGTVLIETSLGGRAGELADRSATSAGGDVFGDQAGRLRYAGVDWRTRAADTPPDATIGNRGLPGELCPNRWEIVFDRSDFSTRVNYGRVGEDAATLDDDVNAVARGYGVETWDMTSMETVSDDILTALAERALRVRSFDLAPRVAAVHVDAARAGIAELLAAASPFTPSFYACGLVQAGRTVFARSLYLTGVEHTITAAAWTARLALDDAAPWQTNSNARYDTAHYDADLYAVAV